ncbi:MAG: hypothetical protein KGV58_01545 [Campylobacteraceae bacterium]|nr:hypothetical protein [Campylobacteraceae bacterium]
MKRLTSLVCFLVGILFVSGCGNSEKHTYKEECKCKEQTLKPNIKDNNTSIQSEETAQNNNSNIQKEQSQDTNIVNDEVNHNTDFENDKPDENTSVQEDNQNDNKPNIDISKDKPANNDNTIDSNTNSDNASNDNTKPDQQAPNDKPNSDNEPEKDKPNNNDDSVNDNTSDNNTTKPSKEKEEFDLKKDMIAGKTLESQKISAVFNENGTVLLKKLPIGDKKGTWEIITDEKNTILIKVKIALTPYKAYLTFNNGIKEGDEFLFKLPAFNMEKTYTIESFK